MSGVWSVIYHQLHSKKAEIFPDKESALRWVADGERKGELIFHGANDPSGKPVMDYSDFAGRKKEVGE